MGPFRPLWEQPYALTTLATGLLATLLALVTIWKSPRAPAARCWGIMCACVAGWAFVNVLSILAVQPAASLAGSGARTGQDGRPRGVGSDHESRPLARSLRSGRGSRAGPGPDSCSVAASPTRDVRHVVGHHGPRRRLLEHDPGHARVAGAPAREDHQCGNDGHVHEHARERPSGVRAGRLGR